MDQTTSSRTLQHYHQLLKDQRETSLEGTHDKNYIDETGIGGTHFEGWRDPYKCDAIHLYCKGALSLEQVIAVAGDAEQPNAGIAPKHHIAALDSCEDDGAFFALCQEMVKHGIDVYRLEATRARMNGKVAASGKREQAALNSRPTIIRDGKVEIVQVKAKPVTAKELAVQEALLRAGKRERLVKEIEKLKAEKARKGMEVTDALRAELIARHTKKEIVIK